MKRPYLLLAFLLFLLSCSKHDTPDPDNGDGNEPPVEDTYSIKEDFEGANKQAYALGDVTLKTGSWSFDDALVNAIDADAKIGLQSVRIRNNGSISTNFEITGLKEVAVSFATYGTDAPCTWQLYVATAGDGDNFEPIGDPIDASSHDMTSDTVSIEAEGPVKIRIKKTGGNRINIDDVTFIGTGDSGIEIGEPEGGDDNPGQEAAPPRGVTVGEDAPPSSGDDSNLLFGNPSNASGPVEAPNNYLLDNHYYTLSYNRDRATPNWTSWHLDNSNFSGDGSRQDNYAGFSGLLDGWYQVSNLSYSGSGFDRGHNCPSGDRTSSNDANSATFLMVNMIPQAPKNNQGPWEKLETEIRNRVGETKEAYIIMGSYGEGGEGTNGLKTKIDNDHITVPAHVWKVALILTKGDGDLDRVDANTEFIAVDMPNTNSVEDNWEKYKVSIDEIEEATGYNLLSSLPASVQDALEVKTGN